MKNLETYAQLLLDTLQSIPPATSFSLHRARDRKIEVRNENVVISFFYSDRYGEDLSTKVYNRKTGTSFSYYELSKYMDRHPDSAANERIYLQLKPMGDSIAETIVGMCLDIEAYCPEVFSGSFSFLDN